MENQRVNYNKEMPVEDWTEGLYRNLSAIKIGIWLLVGLEAAKFILW